MGGKLVKHPRGFVEAFEKKKENVNPLYLCAKHTTIYEHTSKYNDGIKPTWNTKNFFPKWFM